jgi:hypothetical protein
MRIALPTCRPDPLVRRPRPPVGRLLAPVGRLASAAVLLALLLSIASPASADQGTTIIYRCTNGKSLSGFSQAAYRQALQELPTEVEEYSDCAGRIRRAQLEAAGQSGSSSAGAGAGAIPVTPAEQSALRSASKLGPVPLQIGNQVVRPGVIHANIASALNTLPTPLIAILAFLFVCALLLAGRALRNRVRAHRAG